MNVFAAGGGATSADTGIECSLLSGERGDFSQFLDNRAYSFGSNTHQTPPFACSVAISFSHQIACLAGGKISNFSPFFLVNQAAFVPKSDEQDWKLQYYSVRFFYGNEAIDEIDVKMNTVAVYEHLRM